MEKLTKEAVAIAQLDRAIRLFEEGDCVCAITLAGAADDILGSLLVREGKVNSLTALNEASAALHQHFTGEELEPRVFGDRANSVRNFLKHLVTSVGPAIEVDLIEEATDMIDRAVSNYWLLRSEETPAMARFKESQLHRD